MSLTVEERRARVIVERLPLVTYMVRLEAPSHAVFVSPQMESLFGLSSKEFNEYSFCRNALLGEIIVSYVRSA